MGPSMNDDAPQEVEVNPVRPQLSLLAADTALREIAELISVFDNVQKNNRHWAVREIDRRLYELGYRT